MYTKDCVILSFRRIYMDIFDTEKEIITFFQSVQKNETILIPNEDTEAINLFQSITDISKWKHWIDSSAHDAPPPDFYNDTMKIMMDIMRVDDHGYKNKKGKTVNPTRQRESILMKELQNAGILSTFPNAKPIVIADTGLPTEQDHNYQYYMKNFISIIKSHKYKISNYKKNHPGYKIVFFIFDESSMYFETNIEIKNQKIGDKVMGIPHFGFIDNSFLQTILHTEIDYLIWFTPYKHTKIYDNNYQSFEPPKAAIINSKKYPEEYLKKYDPKHMSSTEL